MSSSSAGHIFYCSSVVWTQQFACIVLHYFMKNWDSTTSLSYYFPSSVITIWDFYNLPSVQMWLWFWSVVFLVCCSENEGNSIRVNVAKLYNTQLRCSTLRNQDKCCTLFNAPTLCFWGLHDLPRLNPLFDRSDSVPSLLFYYSGLIFNSRLNKIK